MKPARLTALVAGVGLCAWAAWPRQPQIIDSHQATRQFVIHSTLDRVDDAVVVIGDSIVEGSTLPRSLCGHPVVNAGIGGLSTTTALRARFGDVLQKRVLLVVVSLGSNDAAIPNSVDTFRANYRSLLTELRPLAQYSAVAKIPSPEAGLPEAQRIDLKKIDDYNAALPEIARDAAASVIELPSMPAKHTFDGVHLNAAGYGVWEKALSDGIEAIVCKPRS